PEQVRLADPRTPRDHLGRSPRVPVHRELRDRLREHQLPPPLRGHPRPPGPPAARGHLRPRGPLANRLLSHASKVSNHSLLCQPLAHPLPPRPPRLAAKGGAWPTRPPLGRFGGHAPPAGPPPPDRKSTRLNSSHANISYAVFCLKKKTRTIIKNRHCEYINCNNNKKI